MYGLVGSSTPVVLSGAICLRKKGNVERWTLAGSTQSTVPYFSKH